MKIISFIEDEQVTEKIPKGKRIKRTPAMAANLIDRIWPMREILAYPIC